MYNCRNQETVITVIPTSRHGQPYDIARVEAIFQLETPLNPGEMLYVPNLEKMPANILEMLRLSNVQLSPMPQSYIDAALSDFAQESADPNRTAETEFDGMLGIVRKYLEPVAPIQLGADNFYRVSYEYSVYPSADGSYTIFATLPFKGFEMPAGSQVRFITVLPTGANIDADATKGIALNQQLVEEQVADVAQGRKVVSFFWQNDPDFTVKYNY